ncbi:MAG: hypothetical protein QOD04_1155 [Pseudonocardiales bacterium]|nr:hypothetical protein [Pseudonocardiales bacterium]
MNGAQLVRGTSAPDAVPASRAVGSPVLVVLTAEPDPPGWAVDWCHWSGRELRTRHRSGRPRHSPPATFGQDVADLVGVPVLVVRPTPPRQGPAHVIAAIGGLPDDADVLANAEQSAVYLGASLVIVHGVPRSFAERSVGLDSAVERGRQLLETATRHANQAVPGLEVTSRLLRAHPHELVGETFGAELFVVGVPATRCLSSLDRTATSALGGAHCPILLVPRHREI